MKVSTALASAARSARAHRFSDAALESESQGQHGITHRGSIAIERSRVVDPTLFGRHGRNACAV